MQQRKATHGRPSGTDGSDFSYRMVVDSRYQMVAKGKKCLQVLNIIEAFFLLVGFIWTYLLGPRHESANTLFVSSVICGVISLMIGELGQRRSRMGLLRVYIVLSSIAIIICITCFTKSQSLMEVLQEIRSSKTSKFDIDFLRILPGMIYILGLLLLHIFVVKTSIALISNMSPSKRAS